MCLAVPGRIIAIEGDEATVDYYVEKRTAKLLEEYRVGEYIIVQGGFAVARVSEAEAEAALKLYREALG